MGYSITCPKCGGDSLDDGTLTCDVCGYNTTAERDALVQEVAALKAEVERQKDMVLKFQEQSWVLSAEKVILEEKIKDVLRKAADDLNDERLVPSLMSGQLYAVEWLRRRSV